MSNVVKLSIFHKYKIQLEHLEDKNKGVVKICSGYAGKSIKFTHK